VILQNYGLANITASKNYSPGKNYLPGELI